MMTDCLKENRKNIGSDSKDENAHIRYALVNQTDGDGGGHIILNQKELSEK